jgi:ribosomal protein L11 methyltransferase
MTYYKDLYVYEISGLILGSRGSFTEDFLGCWNEGETSYLFFDKDHDPEVEALAHQRGLRLVSKNVLDYASWQGDKELKPFRVGTLLISPPWETAVPQPGETVILLDPCVVFGDGQHPTTRSCLSALLWIFQQDKPGTVLDLGTGTGILALAAAKWGASRVLAIDQNELAVETALRNVASNGESQRIEVKLGRAEDFVDEEADLVCANIHLQIIEALLATKGFYQKRWYVLSGLFAKDAEGIERQLVQNAITIVDKPQERNWVTLVGFRETG